jgi:transcription initiation factor TFIIIB Brf1 subunit/transcription initiation factor TFIIB
MKELMDNLQRVWLQVAFINRKNDKGQPQRDLMVCDCGGTKILYETLVCTECGKCDAEYITDEPEWKGGVGEDGEVSDPSRVGAPVDDRYSESWSMGTKITLGKYSSYAEKKMARIDFHNSMNYKDRSLFHNYKNIQEAGTGLPAHVVREAEHMYKKFSEEKLTRGNVRLGIKANCLLHACKQNKIARSVEEIATSFGIVPKDVSRTIDMFKEVIQPQESGITMASDVVVRMINQFIMIDDIKRRRLKLTAIKYCEKVQEDIDLLGKTPKTIATAVVLILLEPLKISRETILEICGVSSPTIKKIEDIVREKIRS